MEASDIVSAVLSSVALLVSIAAFVYGNLWRGRLAFFEPNVHMITRINRGTANAVIGFPVNMTNTGAVVHTVNFLYGRLVLKDGQWQHYFDMQTELDGIPPSPKRQSLARMFAVPPRTSHTKVIGFASREPDVDIRVGKYKFELYSCTDGKRAPRRPNLSFELVVTAETLRAINEGGIHVDYGHYAPQRHLA